MHTSNFKISFPMTHIVPSKKIILPVIFSSGATNSFKSGSSPYQKIHNSLALARLRGGGSKASGVGRADPEHPKTRRHTHRISAAKHRE